MRSRRVPISVAVLSMLLAGCQEQPANAFICRASGSNGQGDEFASGYFPPQFGKASEDSRAPGKFVSEFKSLMYPAHWQAAAEPSLYMQAPCEALPEFILRFSYFPSFGSPTFIRVEADGGGMKLIAKQLTEGPGHEDKTLVRSREVRLSGKEVSELKKLLTTDPIFSELFADCLVYADNPGECAAGLDGSQWVFEQVDRRGYRMIDRWSPENGPAVKLGNFLMKLSGWQVELY